MGRGSADQILFGSLRLQRPTEAAPAPRSELWFVAGVRVMLREKTDPDYLAESWRSIQSLPGQDQRRPGDGMRCWQLVSTSLTDGAKDSALALEISAAGDAEEKLVDLDGGSSGLGNRAFAAAVAYGDDIVLSVTDIFAPDLDAARKPFAEGLVSFVAIEDPPQ